MTRDQYLEEGQLLLERWWLEETGFTVSPAVFARLLRLAPLDQVLAATAEAAAEHGDGEPWSSDLAEVHIHMALGLPRQSRRKGKRR